MIKDTDEGKTQFADDDTLKYIDRLSARCEELEAQLEQRKSTNAGWRAYQQCREAFEDTAEQLTAEHEISRKLYEALVYSHECGWNTRAGSEAIAEYESQHKGEL